MGTEKSEEQSYPKSLPNGTPSPCPYYNGFMGGPMPMDDEEISLLEYWNVVWQRKWMISALIFIVTAVTTIYSIMLPNIYRATAAILPVEQEKTLPSGLAGMAAQIAGISLPGSPTMDEIKGLLDSNILKKNLIEKYDLIYLLFPDKWDKEKKQWKEPGRSTHTQWIRYLNPRFLLSRVVRKIHPAPESNNKQIEENDPAPDIYDGIRALEGMISVNEKRTSSELTISIEDKDPRFAAKLVEYLMVTLKEHMRDEALRVAKAQKEYLIKQLDTTTDPIIKNKIYELIAAQVEKETMIGNMEGFAFKVLDPPMVPDQKVKPKRARMVMLSMVIGTFLGVFLVFFMEYIKKERQNSKKKNGQDAFIIS